ncbi:hypothetical protein MLD38_025511 [Melastoma candidum]|uniref:Uncharacterized protein n=1 Tax=Melastoma candidum TaxID=119954 RepID=A0ACB9NX70_9MYRT|nr:hypothetical protein MLD38_025511 [Melastoma candidum]
MGTSEHMEDEGDSATAFTLARILSNVRISRGGPTSLFTFDVHALQERFYLGDNILRCFETLEVHVSASTRQIFFFSRKKLAGKSYQETPRSQAFPYDGAWKRFHKQLQHFPTIVLIVDNLVQSGRTLIECQLLCASCCATFPKILAALGAEKISAYVTHGIFLKKSWECFNYDNAGTAKK